MAVTSYSHTHGSLGPQSWETLLSKVIPHCVQGSTTPNNIQLGQSSKWSELPVEQFIV